MIKKSKKIIKTIIKIVVFCFIIGSLFSIGVLAYFAKDLPDPTKIDEREVIESTKIYDRTGQIILYDIHGEEKEQLFNLKKFLNLLKIQQ